MEELIMQDPGDYSPELLNKCSYRYLQRTAKDMGLPCNVKKVYLIQLIYTKKYCSEVEVEKLIAQIRMERQQCSLARKEAKKMKRIIQQSTEISSTSNSKSPPINATPKRVSHVLVRYSPDLYIPPRRRANRGSTNRYTGHASNVFVGASDRVLRSCRNVKTPAYVLDKALIGVFKDSSSEESVEQTPVLVDKYQQVKITKKDGILRYNNEIVGPTSLLKKTWQQNIATSTPKINCNSTELTVTKTNLNTSILKRKWNNTTVPVPKKIWRENHMTSTSNLNVTVPSVSQRNFENQTLASLLKTNWSRPNAIPQQTWYGIDTTKSVPQTRWNVNDTPRCGNQIATSRPNKDCNSNLVALSHTGRMNIVATTQRDSWFGVENSVPVSIRWNDINMPVSTQNNEDMSPQPVRQQRRLSGIYPLSEEPKTTTISNVSVRRADGTISILNAFIQKTTKEKAEIAPELPLTRSIEYTKAPELSNMIKDSTTVNNVASVTKQNSFTQNSTIKKPILELPLNMTSETREAHRPVNMTTQEVRDKCIEATLNKTRKEIRDKYFKALESKKTREETRDKSLKVLIEKTREETRDKSHKAPIEKTREESRANSLKAPMKKTREETRDKSLEPPKKKTREETRDKSVEAPKKKIREEIRQTSLEAPMKKIREEIRHRSLEAPIKKIREETRDKSLKAPIEKTREEIRHRSLEAPMKKNGVETRDKPLEPPMSKTREEIRDKSLELSMNKTRNETRDTSIKLPLKKIRVETRDNSIEPPMKKAREETRDEPPMKKSRNEPRDNSLEEPLNYSRKDSTENTSSLDSSQSTSDTSENYSTEETLSNTSVAKEVEDEYTTYYHKKIRADKLRARRAQKAAKSPNKCQLPKINEVFTSFNSVYQRDGNQPIYTKVNMDPVVASTPSVPTYYNHQTSMLPVVSNYQTYQTSMIESLYNIKNTFIVHQPLLPIATTTSTRCVYTTPIRCTATAHTPAGVTNLYNALPRVSPACFIVEEEPRVHDYFQNYQCDDVATETTSDVGRACSPVTSLKSQDLGANVTIPEMVEDALELISQDGDYLERMELDDRMQCVLCDWAGPKIILEYHIRKEHESEIMQSPFSCWCASYRVGELWACRQWRGSVVECSGRLLAVAVKCGDDGCALATIMTIPSEDDLQTSGSMTIYDKVTGEPYSWKGLIPSVPPLPYTWKSADDSNCLKFDLSRMNLFPSNFVIGQPELDDIAITIIIRLDDFV